MHPLYTRTLQITIKVTDKHITYKRKICLFGGFYAFLFLLLSTYRISKSTKTVSIF